MYSSVHWRSLAFHLRNETLWAKRPVWCHLPLPNDLTTFLIRTKICRTFFIFLLCKVFVFWSSALLMIINTLSKRWRCFSTPPPRKLLKSRKRQLESQNAKSTLGEVRPLRLRTKKTNYRSGWVGLNFQIWKLAPQKCTGPIFHSAPRCVRTMNLLSRTKVVC